MSLLSGLFVQLLRSVPMHLNESTMLLDDPRFTRRLKELSAASDRVWFVALTVGLSFTLVAAYLFPFGESPSGKFWAYAGLLIRGGLYAWSKDGLRGRGGEILWRLFAVGLVAGVFGLL